MNKHVKYLKYVLKHKYYVFKECCRLGIPWLGITHDWSKFLPSEWFPYAEHFYGTKESNFYGISYDKERSYDIAWLKHQKRNKHHWQYWILRMDEGTEKCLKIPDKYIKEMCADWIGAGKAINGHNDVLEWYSKNKNRMKMDYTDLVKVESILGVT